MQTSLHLFMLSERTSSSLDFLFTSIEQEIVYEKQDMSSQLQQVKQKRIYYVVPLTLGSWSSFVPFLTSSGTCDLA